MQEIIENNSEISERIIQVIDYLGVSKNDFAKKLGYTRSQSLYDITNGKSSPSFDFFNKLLNSEYSEIFNINWIIAAKGEMLNEKDFKRPPPIGKCSNCEILEAKLTDKEETITFLKSSLADKDEIIAMLKTKASTQDNKIKHRKAS